MDKRVGILVGVAAAVLGALLMVFATPDTGPAVERPKPVPVAAPAPQVSAKSDSTPLPRRARPKRKASDEPDVGEPLDFELAKPEPAEPEIEPDPVYAADRDGLRKAWDQHGKDFWACYSPFIVRYPELTNARIRMAFDIEDDGDGGGKLTHAFVESSDFDEPRIENCLMDVWRSLEFDPPEGDGPAEFSFPMRLKVQ